jgi:hypothetical protein
MKTLNEAEIARAFLKYHKKWSAFKKHREQQGSNDPNYCPVIDFIDDAFTWSNTKEGHVFWASLNNKFHIMLDHFGISGQDMTLADVLELK